MYNLKGKRRKLGKVPNSNQRLVTEFMTKGGITEHYPG